MSIIEVKNLTKTYGSFRAVDHISFTVESGTMLGFLGVNGAGKSTTINMLSTLLLPSEGEARICGYTLGKDDKDIRRNIGIVYQQNCLDPLLTVQENLICRGILHGASRSGAKKQLQKVCELLKLQDILKKKYKVLSGGQKRRCEIGAALMHTPKVLFLDEPTTGLDPATRKDVWEIVEGLQKEENMTVFLTTHYMEEAAAAHRIIILDHGRILAEGTPFALKERFAMDSLKLYSKKEQVHTILSLPPFLDLPIKEEPDYIKVGISDTKAALPLISAAEGLIDGFEVIQGNMDDVFLNAIQESNHMGGIR